MGNNKRYYFITGLICLSGMMALAITFFKERIAFCDTAYQSVYLLIEHKPFIIWIRPGAVLPQLIPLGEYAAAPRLYGSLAPGGRYYSGYQCALYAHCLPLDNRHKISGYIQRA